MKYEQMRPANKVVEALWVPGETVRPYGYFAAQTAFALKALELGLADTVVQALEQFSAIPRKIMGNKNPVKAQGSHWMDTVEVLTSKPASTDHQALTDTLFAKYLSYPDASTYTKPPLELLNGRQIGAFTHDFDQTEAAIRLHFVERVRGPKSEFGETDRINRMNDMRELFAMIKRKNYTPTPTTVTSGSWMYNIRSVINVMPQPFRDSAGAPPRLSFGGDSLWGQFVTSDGGYHAGRYAEFLSKLEHAYDIESMVAAFPLPVLFLQARLTDFFDYYHIDY